MATRHLACQDRFYVTFLPAKNIIDCPFYDHVLCDLGESFKFLAFYSRTAYSRTTPNTPVSKVRIWILESGMQSTGNDKRSLNFEHFTRAFCRFQLPTGLIDWRAKGNGEQKPTIFIPPWQKQVPLPLNIQHYEGDWGHNYLSTGTVYLLLHASSVHLVQNISPGF